MCHFKCERSRCFYMLLRLYMLSCAFCLCFYTFIHLYMLPYAFLRFFYAFSKLSYAFLCFPALFLCFPTLSYAFTCFYMLLHALFGRSVRTTRTTREAASLSNRLLPAEAGKNPTTHKAYSIVIYIPF